jgi:hypothetical protein
MSETDLASEVTNHAMGSTPWTCRLMRFRGWDVTNASCTLSAVRRFQNRNSIDASSICSGVALPRSILRMTPCRDRFDSYDSIKIVRAIRKHANHRRLDQAREPAQVPRGAVRGIYLAQIRRNNFSPEELNLRRLQIRNHLIDDRDFA